MSFQNPNNSRISGLSKTLLFLAALLLTVSIFIPIWRIDLDAPQYPEGLSLLIYANKLGGDVEIINGLNHYIGMKTLHAEDFIEFTLLPYLIGFFALASLLTLVSNKKRMVYILMSAFVLFGIIAMTDFWRWEYNYGHNLNPNAAIIVPGMAYQPPLIGFKQLLNFGAFSIPALGGWLFIGSGISMLITVLIESKFLSRFGKKKPASALLPFIFLFLMACSNAKPEAVKLNTDRCDFCNMTISNIQFAAELVTDKGRCYKFDDLACLINYKKENSKMSAATAYVCDFVEPNHLLITDSLVFIRSENIGSPMGGNTAAFSNSESAEPFRAKYSASVTTWQNLYK